MENVAVVCKRACCEFLSCLSGRIFEEVFEDVVEVSGDESGHWCQASVCGLDSVLSVLILILLVDMECDLDLLVTEFEVDESQTHSVFQKCGVTSSTRKRKQARTQRQSSRCPRGRQSKHFLKNKEYSSTSARRNAIARKVDVAWPTVNSST